MKKKFINDISANSFQVIINQFCGIIIFYLLSTGLDKNNFGEINWVLAILLTSFNILTFGMDQVVIKKIASGNEPGYILSLYTSHTLFAGAFFYGVLLLSHYIFTDFFLHHRLLLLLGIGKLMIFFSTPFKQLSIGLEKFRPLLFMSVTSNIIKSIALLVFAVLKQLDLASVLVIFIAGDMIELVICFTIARYQLKIPIQIKWDPKGYRQLIKESLPQTGVVIFTSAIARFDWILLGIMASNIILAEYSFAYKVFEMATLPLLIIAPILITRFTKIFHPPSAANHTGKINDLVVLLKIEMIIASLVAMVLVICWVPLVDWITNGKYGAVNRVTVFILAVSMPLLYFNNFLWTIQFARGALKTTFYIFLFTFLVNIIADIILIPFFKGEGAAIAYLLAIFFQSLLFLQKTQISNLPVNWLSSLLIPVSALLSSVLASLFLSQWWLVLPVSIFFFAISLLITSSTRHTDRAVFKRVTGI